MSSSSTSQSSSRLLSAGDVVTVWDPPPDFGEVHSFNPHEGCNVGSISWNHDFTIIASAGINHDKVYVTYAPAGYVSHDLEAEGLPCSVRFANYSNDLSVGTSTGVVQLWDVKTRKVKKTFQASKLCRITSTAFNHNDGFIAAGTSGGEISLLNTVTGTVSQPMIASKTNSQAVSAVQYSFHKKYWLASSSENGSVYLWDVNTRQLTHAFREIHRAPATGLTFSTLNEMFMLSAGLDNNVVCYDVRDKKTIKNIATDYCLSALDLMPDGVTLAVGSTRGKIIIFDLRKGNTPVKYFNAHKDKVQKLAFQKCGSKRAAALERSSSSGGVVANRDSGKASHKSDKTIDVPGGDSVAATTSTKTKKHQHGSTGASSKPTRDANDNEEISTHHSVTHQSSTSGHHSGGGGSSSHKHHTRKASGGGGGDGGGATPEMGLSASEVDSAVKDSIGGTKGAEATTPSSNAHHHHHHHMRHKSHNAVITNIHSTSSSVDDSIFSPLRGPPLPGGRTSSHADPSVISSGNNTLGVSLISATTPDGMAGNKSLSKSASGLFRSQHLHGKSSLTGYFDPAISPLNTKNPGGEDPNVSSFNINDGSSSVFLSPTYGGSAHSHHPNADASIGDSSIAHGTSHTTEAQINYHPVNGSGKDGLSVPPSTLPKPLVEAGAGPGGGSSPQLPSPNPNAPFTCLHNVKDPSTVLGGTSVHNHPHHRKEKTDGTERSGSSKHHLHHQPHSHDGVTGTQGQVQQHYHHQHHHHQPHTSQESSFGGVKGVNEACCSGPLSSAIHVRGECASLDPGCATSAPLGFAPSILGPGASRGFTAVPSSLMHKSASSSHLRKSPDGAGTASLFSGASSLAPPPSGLAGASSSGASHGLLVGGAMGGASASLGPHVDDPLASNEACQVKHLKEFIREEVGDLKDDIRRYIVQVQFEMVRQFEIQLGEIQQILQVGNLNQHQLMQENEALKKEIQNLKKIY